MLHFFVCRQFFWWENTRYSKKADVKSKQKERDLAISILSSMFFIFISRMLFLCFSVKQSACWMIVFRAVHFIHSRFCPVCNSSIVCSLNTVVSLSNSCISASVVVHNKKTPSSTAALKLPKQIAGNAF